MPTMTALAGLMFAKVAAKACSTACGVWARRPAVRILKAGQGLGVWRIIWNIRAGSFGSRLPIPSAELAPAMLPVQPRPGCARRGRSSSCRHPGLWIRCCRRRGWPARELSRTGDDQPLAHNRSQLSRKPDRFVQTPIHEMYLSSSMSGRGRFHGCAL